MPSSLNVGFIGIGNMGWPMASHVAAAGWPTTVYDKDATRAARFAAEHSATAAHSFAELRRADAIVTMLPTGRDVREVLLDQDGGLAAILRPGTLVIDMSSSEPMGTRELGAALATRNITLIDAPVSGAVPRANSGTLAIMIGCDDPQAVQRVKPLLSSMGNRLFEVGGLGCGHALKALNNFVAAIGFNAAAEALLAGKRFGLDPATLLEVLNAGTARNFATEFVMKEHVIEGRHATGFTLGLLTKDVRIAADLAAAVKLDAPFMRLVSERWTAARDRLGGARDNSEAIRCWDEDL